MTPSNAPAIPPKVRQDGPYADVIRRLHLALVFHNHQPVGNFGWVLDQLYEQSYLPMLECLERHPPVRAAMHYTGFLLDYLRETRPEFIDRVRALVERGQVEVLGGGYFEPILSSIPDRDKQRQLIRLRAAAEESFGVRPTGLWLAERVWEPSLAGDLAEAGYEYTILDDSHFETVGIKGDELFDYYQTEDQGRRLKLLVTLQALRYSIPWHDVGDVMRQLRGMAAEEPRLALMGDDGEKFGGWPGTYQKCWEEGWMDRFFDGIGKSSGWLETVLPGEYTRRYPARGLIYLPPGSYPEMLEWSGGFWRNFLVRYPEINLAHKKMMRTSAKLAEAFQNEVPDEAARPLLRGQSNDAYWHGVFGGVYLPHLRHAVWQSLLESDAVVANQLHREGDWQEVERLDHDYDGHEDILVEGASQNVYVSPALGGSLVEWDVRWAGLNLLDCLQRRPEPYHEKLRAAQVGGEVKNIHESVRAKEPGLARRLAYDRRRRLGLQAYLVPVRSRLGDARRSRLREIGDFGSGPFQAEVSESPRGTVVTLSRQSLPSGRRSRQRVSMTKRIEVDRTRARLGIDVELQSTEDRLTALLLVETNVGVFAGMEDCGLDLDGGEKPHRLDRHLAVPSVQGVHLWQRPAQLDLEVRSEPAAGFWYYPVETVNNSEGGFERILQGCCLATVHPVELDPGETWSVRLEVLANRS